MLHTDAHLTALKEEEKVWGQHQWGTRNGKVARLEESTGMERTILLYKLEQSSNEFMVVCPIFCPFSPTFHFGLAQAIVLAVWIPFTPFLSVRIDDLEGAQDSTDRSWLAHWAEDVKEYLCSECTEVGNRIGRCNPVHMFGKELEKKCEKDHRLPNES